MSFMRGGTILRVDLTSGKVAKEPTSIYEDLWLGSRGINAKIMYDEVPPEVEPMEPANVLIFGVGPFTGSMAPGSSRTEMAAKSPTIGIQGMSSFGGYFGPELKYAGYDNIVITGRASKPVYLAINNDDIQIRDASNLWGMDCFDTPVAIRKDLDNTNVQVACIGPAGENLVVYATVQHRVGNGAGRTGMGAVMGSKNLKAIAVRGTKGVNIAEPERFLEICREAFKIQKATPTYEEFSTGQCTRMVSNDPADWGMVLGNAEATKWDKQKLIPDGLESYWKEHINRLGDGNIGCFNCQMRCKEYYDISELGPIIAFCNYYATTVWPLKLSDFNSWYKLASKCQRYGLDVVATSRMISWATDLYEKNKISKDDTDGIPLVWGDGEAILKLVDKINRREGFGNILASTVQDAKDKIGKNVEGALNTRGAPLTGTNIINWRPRAIGVAMNPRGGDYFRTRYCSFDSLGGTAESGHTGMSSPDSWEAKTALLLVKDALAKEGNTEQNPSIGQFDYTARGALAAFSQKLINVSDMLGQCRWNTIFLNAGIGIELQSKMLSAGEGRERNIDQLMEFASRLAVQERAFAVREGITREKDTLPKRLFNHKMPGYFPDDYLDLEKFEEMKDEYYAAMGWDIGTGIPTRKTLTSLKLDKVALDLEKRGKLPQKEQMPISVKK